MADFPALNSSPFVKEWEETKAFDPTIRSETEGGYVQSRSRFTRKPKKWHIFYPALTAADKSTLETFEDTVGCGADKFNWTNPDNDTVYEVRFLPPPLVFRRSGHLRWKTEFYLEEV